MEESHLLTFVTVTDNATSSLLTRTSVTAVSLQLSTATNLHEFALQAAEVHDAVLRALSHLQPTAVLDRQRTGSPMPTPRSYGSSNCLPHGAQANHDHRPPNGWDRDACGAGPVRPQQHRNQRVGIVSWLC